ncbi:MAG: hypothetical protein AAGA66_14980 [Bacteroidota bacterium]
MMKKIVIANTLKPVDDVRAFEKLAQSMAKTNKYEVNIIGNEGKKESGHPLISFHPHQLSKFTDLQRLYMRHKTLKRIITLSPHVLIVTTHEYLLIGIFYKIFFQCKLIYDVQEDYKKNLLHISKQHLLKKIMATTIRLKEIFSQPFIDQYWLAEATYASDLKFTVKKSTVLENKACISNLNLTNTPNTPSNQLLFSGTISHYSQVLLAVGVFEKINSKRNNLTLKIIGQCHDLNLLETLKGLADKNDQILLEISKEPISHDRILSAIHASLLGIIAYQENPVNRNKVPTKLYEYSMYQLPYVIQQQTSWATKGRNLGGAIPIDFMNPDVEFILHQLDQTQTLFPSNYPESETWESLEGALFKSIDTLFK